MNKKTKIVSDTENGVVVAIQGDSGDEGEGWVK